MLNCATEDLESDQLEKQRPYWQGLISCVFHRGDKEADTLCQFFQSQTKANLVAFHKKFGISASGLEMWEVLAKCFDNKGLENWWLWGNVWLVYCGRI